MIKWYLSPCKREVNTRFDDCRPYDYLEMELNARLDAKCDSHKIVKYGSRS